MCLRAPRDPAAWTRPCLLCTSCICSGCDCEGRCCLLRTPCTCSFAERAGRCSPLRTPCTGSFSDCARIAPPSPLVLASLPRCSLPRLRLAPPAYSCPLHAPPPLRSSRLSHPTAPTALPRAPRRCSPNLRSTCQPWLSHCPPAPCPCHPHPRHQLPPSPPRPRPLPPAPALPV